LVSKTIDIQMLPSISDTMYRYRLLTDSDWKW